MTHVLQGRRQRDSVANDTSNGIGFTFAQVTAPNTYGRPQQCWLPLREALSDDDLAAIQNYLQQQCALGRDNFHSMAKARTQRFAGTRPTHRPARNK